MDEQDFKPLHVRLTTTQRAVLELAAAKLGLTISAYIRMAALNHASALGFHEEAPQVD